MIANAGRHVFLQVGTGRVVATTDQRAESAWPQTGTVSEARYFGSSRETVSRPTETAKALETPRGLWAWLRGLLGGSAAPQTASAPPPPKRGRAKGDEVRWVFPFDDLGADALAFCDPSVPLLDGYDDPFGSIRRVEGTLVCLDPRREGDRVVARDAWVDGAPALRVVELLDFGVLPANGPPVAVCCAMAPLIVAPPAWIPLSEHMGGLSARAKEWLAPHIGDRATQSVPSLRLEEGDRVEVLGVVCEPGANALRFDVRGRSAPFRGAYNQIGLIVGDEPGTRLVVRKLIAAPT